MFGNNPIWHFSAPGLYPTPLIWQQALDSPGSRSMSRVVSLFSSFDWTSLEPDLQGRFLTGGAGTGQDRAVAAQSTDRSLAVAYVPSMRDVRFDLSTMSGPRVSVSWYDPVSGAYNSAAGSPFPASGSQTFRAAGTNSSGDGDWVLIMRSVP
jgi:hypothetical protein